MTPITRRDVLFGLGGGLAGTLFSPLPWTLLDDVAIWTQHRSSLPIPRDGEVTLRSTACTLCPGGCALRVRCIAGRPVFAAGEPFHPLGGGACPFGLTQHQLAHHPLRLAHPARLDAGGRPMRIALGAAMAAVAGALTEAGRAGRGVLVLDQRPGRATSRAYRELLTGVPGGVYATPVGEGATLATLAAPGPGHVLGIDLEHTRTLLSFGAPVLEGWGRPGRMLAARRELRVVQLDTWRSPSAALADEWLAIRPGSEGPLALALAQVLVAEGLVTPPADDVRRLLRSFDLARIAPLVGIDGQRLAALARALVAHGPTVALGGGDPGGGPLHADDERAIALLDHVLGNLGRPGGIVARRDVPDDEHAPLVPECSLPDVPDGQAGLLVMDASDAGRALPWPALERKLAPGALVVSLSPFLAGLARHADVLVPAPAPLETYDEVLPTADAGVASYALAAPLLPVSRGATDPIEVLQRVAQAAGIAQPAPVRMEDRLKRRAAVIQGCGRGRLFVRHDDSFREETATSAEAFWQALVDGGCWQDGADAVPFAAQAPLPSRESVERWTRAEATGASLTLVAFAARGAAGSVPVAPILTKLYQETDLRPSVATVAVNPETARGQGLVEGQRVCVESAAGAVVATLRCDTTLPRGRVALAAGPDPTALHALREPVAQGALALGVVAADLTWRGTGVTLREI